MVWFRWISMEGTFEHTFVWYKTRTNSLTYRTTVVSNDSAVGDVATGYGLDDRTVRVRVPVRLRISLLHNVQTGFWARPASYPMATVGAFLVGKAEGAWNWPPTSNYCQGQQNPYLLPRSRQPIYICFHSTAILHGVVLNYLSTGT
jgi:hypothetical protein